MPDTKKNIIEYKQTPVGLLPKHWEVKRLSELGNTYTGITGKTKIDFGKGEAYIPYKNIYNNIIVDVNQLDYVNIGKDEHHSVVVFGDLLFTASSETPNEVGMTSVFLDKRNKLYLNSFCFGFRLNNFLFLNPLFACFLFRSENVRNVISNLAQGSTRFNLPKSELLKISIGFPSLLEQQKIVEILLVWEKAIRVNEAITTDLQETKKNLTIKLLSGNARFNKLINSKASIVDNDKLKQFKWESKQLADVVTQIKNSVKVAPEQAYRQLGIRSHTKGIFYKEPVSGFYLGNKSVFHVEPDCFIVNIVFAWEHAIAKTTENEIGFIVSHRFPMYKPNPNMLDLDYLLYFFKSKKGKDLLALASPGGAGRNKTLGQKEFLKLKIPIPPLEEQRKIAAFLSNLDKEIELYQQKLEQLQIQKKGLMQQLLTGKVLTILKKLK
ncbi:MAG: hypothetical protein RL660_1117 [Bacteroidota bacterium]|jgi:restriction endonuclease S subunit